MIDNRRVALVGKPNVGKSRLFNRLAGRRIAIVHDQPGVTRDVNAVEIDDDFILMDTGGIGQVSNEKDRASDLTETIEEQVFFAIQAAQLILLVVDSREGCTLLDEMIVEKLRRFGKEPLLVINKIDRQEEEERAIEFTHLGLKKWVLVSAEHGRGTRELHKTIEDLLGPKPPTPTPCLPHRIKICFLGRPNVGKSSLCNSLLRSERLVVSETPGTTRDAITLDLDYQGQEEVWPFRLVDTAGLRKHGKVSSSVEYFSTVRTEKALENTDVGFLILDARSGVTKQDKLLAGRVIEAGKALAVVVNKWDLALALFQHNPPHRYEDEKDFREHFARAVHREIFFMPQAPVCFVSALSGYALEDILITARQLDAIQDRKLPTTKVNRLIMRLFERQKPRLIKGKRFKIYYALQTGNRPLRIRLFCNEPTHLDERYRRYLENGFISEFDLKGCPLKFELVGKPRYTQGFYTTQKN